MFYLWILSRLSFICVLLLVILLQDMWAIFRHSSLLAMLITWRVGGNIILKQLKSQKNSSDFMYVAIAALASV
jgi:hypothetical protein